LGSAAAFRADFFEHVYLDPSAIPLVLERLET
jgi:hypothetical protein